MEHDVEIELEWMWADAEILPGLHFLAHINPLRWHRGKPLKVAEELEAVAPIRQVNMRIVGQHNHLTFESCAAAARWIRDTENMNLVPTPSSSTPDFMGWIVGNYYISGMAIFLRLNPEKSLNWLNSNIFTATSYAHLVKSSYDSVVLLQSHPGRHLKSLSSWDLFDGSPANQLAPLIEIVHCMSRQDRPSVLEVEGDIGKEVEGDKKREKICPRQRRRGELALEQWEMIHLTTESSHQGGKCAGRPEVALENQYWAAFRNRSDPLALVVAFRGGDGGVFDAKNHPGSPLRAFYQDNWRTDSETIPPALWEALPVAALLRIHDQVPGISVTLCAYSMGGVAALTSALLIGDQPWLKNCFLYNCASLYWPRGSWFSHLLNSQRITQGASARGAFPAPALASTPTPPLRSHPRAGVGGGGGGAGDWWLEGGPAVSSKIETWVVRDDFLSDRLPGGSIVAPQCPGRTHLLPPQTLDGNFLRNHNFDFFLDPECRIR